MSTPTLTPLPELKPEQLYHRCDPTKFAFGSTAELGDLAEGLGQGRAVEAICFGIGIQREGYNLYAMGPAGAGKHTIVRRFVDEKAGGQPVPADWCYVHNFHDAHQPRALQLPPGRARMLHDQMAQAVEDLRVGIPAAFETDEYRSRVQQIEAEFSERQEKLFSELSQQAREKSVALLRTPSGLALAPLHKDEVIDAEEFGKLPPEERRQIKTAMEELHHDLEDFLHDVPKWRRETQHKIRELNRVVTRAAVNSLIDELKKNYDGFPEVQRFLEEVEADVIEHADDFRRSKDGEAPALFGIPLGDQEGSEASLRRYRVNVLIDHSEARGAPVVYEDNPAHDALIGRIEHLAQMGTLVTDFTLIKPGALHKANGGYLILDALKVLSQPFAWEALKRALRSREIKIESLGQRLSLVSTISLEPEAIPLDVKVMLVGERLLYYLLCAYDPEFPELFKVAADFQDDMSRSPENVQLYAQLVATLARKDHLRPFDRGAVARVIEHSSRLAGDAEKLWTQTRSIADLLREADYWAGEAKRERVAVDDVQAAIDAQERRASRIRDRLQEETRRGTILIDSDGLKVGQVNGLSVLQFGDYGFGHPTRITARVRLGAGKVVDIEREVELGGPLHSKGVLILSGYLAGRYIPDQPLTLSASLVFEQSYAGVEGDSASSAELYALLSALADVPIKQSFAVTGSVNQRGEVQAIGGVNEKIEGFFDLCRVRGLNGAQGVLIPSANVKHLMLRGDVVSAAAAGRFHIHPVDTIDQGLALLTGMTAGERGADGAFPAGSFNARVEARLSAFAAQARAFRAPGESGSEKGRD
ncbi:MAG TPA: ATP-binding protein [Opitutaceae bacterium]